MFGKEPKPKPPPTRVAVWKHPLYYSYAVSEDGTKYFGQAYVDACVEDGTMEILPERREKTREDFENLMSMSESYGQRYLLMEVLLNIRDRLMEKDKPKVSGDASGAISAMLDGLA